MKISIIISKVALARINSPKKAKCLIIHLIIGVFTFLSKKKNSFGWTLFASKNGRKKNQDTQDGMTALGLLLDLDLRKIFISFFNWSNISNVCGNKTSWFFSLCQHFCI
jgi:hypothetical protein